MTTNKNSENEYSLRINPLDENREWVEIYINNQTVLAREGEKLTAALLAAGYRTMHHKEFSGAPRGMFCGMGVCHDCIVTVNGHPFIHACLTKIEPGMRVEVDSEWVLKQEIS
jgi:predicted molibdopterin-dependent oxidoreductase YjgC